MRDLRESPDYLTCDLSIRKILQIYRQTNPSWSRPQAYARTADGFLYFLRGGIHYDFDGFSFDAMEGDVLRLPNGIPYSGHKLTSGDNEYFVIDFLSWESTSFLQYPLPHTFHPRDQDGTLQAFERLVSIWEKNEPCRLLDAKSAFLSLIASLTREYVVSLSGNSQVDRMNRICSFIRNHAQDSSLKIQDIADAFYISPTHLRRLFSSQLKTSPGAYLNLIRMNIARKLLLSNQNLTVSEIAEKSGFTSVYYFSSAFKASTGLNCSQYRARYIE